MSSGGAGGEDSRYTITHLGESMKLFLDLDRKDTHVRV
jgi:hypothetical protein